MNTEKRESYLKKTQDGKKIETKIETFKREMPDWKIYKIIETFANWIVIRIDYIIEEAKDDKNRLYNLKS